MAMNKRDVKWEPGTFFYNQPPYTHFNKSFDNPADALFQHLNEVHPVFMKPENLKRDFEYHVLLDPRTKKEVNKILYDHTNEGHQSTEVFRSGVPSNLNKNNHIVCLRLLKAWQEFCEVDEADILHWRMLKRARIAEKDAFDKFLLEYSRTHKEAIYGPTARLVVLYKRLYASKLKQLLLEYPENLALNTYAGLPHAQSYKYARSKNMQIENVRLVTRDGWIAVLEDYTKDLQLLSLRLENYMDYYTDGIDLQNGAKWETSRELGQLTPEFHIPLESLLFLLTAGNFSDLPTEVPLEISESSENSFKIISFKEPLPPRTCGWYTHKMIVENAFEALVSTSKKTQWLYVENDDVKLQKVDSTPEIKAVRNTEISFRPYEFNEYIQNLALKRENCIKSNFADVEWNLNGKDDEKNKIELQLFTRLKLGPAKDESGAQLLSSHSIKLEYKSQFGAELMTKYELLKEWLRIKLLSQCKGFTDYGLNLRVAVNNFTVQLKHRLILTGIEQQLAEVYHIQMPQLLAGLADTLQLLLNMPPGKYFLRYNSKYPDKLLLSAPSTEITPNTVFLHTLINVEPSDLAFMTDVQHLPISDSLCTALHDKYKMMPCAFKPRNPLEKGSKIPPKTYRTFKSDEEYVQKRLQAKLALKIKKEEELQRKNKGRRSKVKRKKSKQRKKLKNEDDSKADELEKFVNEF